MFISAGQVFNVFSVLDVCVILFQLSLPLPVHRSQLPNKFHGHFATPLEYVISLICRPLRCVR